MIANDLAEVIVSRRTIQVFTPEPVTEAILHKALELALWAPNHKLTMPWRFVRLGPLSRERLADISVRLKAAKGPLSDTEAQLIRQKFLRPAELIVVAQPLSADRVRAREDYAAIAAGLQNAALFLWAQGVGSKWSTGAVIRDAATYRVLEIDPGQTEIVGLFWVGRFQRVPPASNRPALAEVLRTMP